MKRTIIKIDEEKCNGCGNCVSGCHEGALQLVNGKAVMISDLYCDGLGACIGECPVGAITLEEREAEPYNEYAVMERLVPKGDKIIKAHLNHLKEHGEMVFYQEGLNYLKEHNINFDVSSLGEEKKLACGCPGSMSRELKKPVLNDDLQQNTEMEVLPSELRQFPIQLQLLNPNADFFKKANLLLAADCTAFAYGNFHSRFLKGKILAIACPKLDSNVPQYISKLTYMIDNSEIETLTVLIMEVPCCGGLVRIAEIAREQATRNVPIKVIMLSVQGEVISEKWI